MADQDKIGNYLRTNPQTYRGGALIKLSAHICEVDLSCPN